MKFSLPMSSLLCNSLEVQSPNVIDLLSDSSALFFSKYKLNESIHCVIFVCSCFYLLCFLKLFILWHFTWVCNAFSSKLIESHTNAVSLHLTISFVFILHYYFIFMTINSYHMKLNTFRHAFPMTILFQKSNCLLYH